MVSLRAEQTELKNTCLRWEVEPGINLNAVQTAKNGKYEGKGDTEDRFRCSNCLSSRRKEKAVFEKTITETKAPWQCPELGKVAESLEEH